ncbi:MAG: transcriptional regulator, partial [Shewanella sp.]
QNHAELGKVVAFREWMLDMFAEESRSELLPG